MRRILALLALFLAFPALSHAAATTTFYGLTTGTQAPCVYTQGGQGCYIPSTGLIAVTTGGQNGIGFATASGSGTITTGGTAQALFSGTTPAHGWKVSLPVTSGSQASFTCYVSDETTTPSATTAGSQVLFAGGQYSTEDGQLPLGPVYITCPTTGIVFSAQYW